MEVIVFVIIASIIWWVVSAVLKTGGAALKTAVGEGTFSENLGGAFADLSEFQMRAREGRIG